MARAMTACSSATPHSWAFRRPLSLPRIVYSGVMSFVLLKLIGLVHPTPRDGRR